MKKIIVFLLSLTIALTPTFLWAGAAEKWEVLQNNYDHVTNKVKIEARKITQDAANSGRYKVNVPVNPSTLGSTAKMMLKGGVATAAITALVQGVGWLIENGAIVKPLIQPPSTAPKAKIYLVNGSNFPNSGSTHGNFESCKGYYSESASIVSCLQSKVKDSSYKVKLNSDYSTLYANALAKIVNSTTPKIAVVSTQAIELYKGSERLTYFHLNVGIDPALPDQDPSQTYTPVSDSELGNEILGKGTEPNSRPQPSPDIITEAYSPNNPVQEAPAPQETIRALENANPQPETEPSGETKPKPNTDTDGDGEPDVYDPAQPEQGTEFQLPNFCEWAPAVCDFFTVQKADNKDIKNNQREQIEQDKTFFEKVSDWFDWTKQEPEQDTDTEVDVEQPEEFDTSIFTKDRFQVSRQCPVPEQHTITLTGVSVSFTFDLTPLCTVLEMARPALVACSYLYAAYIVIGAARNG